MSPHRLSLSRKRRFSDSSDDESDYGFPLKKGISKGVNEEDKYFTSRCLANSLQYFRTNVLNRMGDLLRWIGTVRASPKFIANMKLGATLPISNIDDDDKEEVTIINEVPGREIPNPFSNRLHSRQVFLSHTRRKPTFEIPDAFACAGLRKLNLEESDVSENGSYRRVGNSDAYFLFNSSIDTSATNALRQRHSEYLSSANKSILPRVVSPFTNPQADMEILDVSEKTSSDADDVVIISDEPTPCKSSLAIKSTKVKSVISINDRSTFSKTKSSKRNNSKEDTLTGVFKPYTANEVIRLQEKKLYQQLLNKYKKNQTYYPVEKSAERLQIKSNVSNSALFENPFKVSRKSVNSYVEKYVKPLQEVSTQQSPDKIQAKPDEDDSDDVIEIDDDLSIIKVCLPKYKPRFTIPPDSFGAEWLSQLQLELHAETVERKKIEENYSRQINDYKKKRLRSIITKHIEPQKEREKRLVETPKITPEMISKIDAAMNLPAESIISVGPKGCLHQKDLETLTGLNWLNDNVINYYMDLIVDRSSKDENLPNCYNFNTFFYPKLKQFGYITVKRWTRKVDIFSYDQLFVPLHLEVHWALAVVYPKRCRIEYYDSMGSGEMECFAVLSDYLANEMKERKGKISPEYDGEKMNAPVQMNGSDCGMFTLKYAECISRNAPMNFIQENIPYFRRRMMYELLTNKLL